MNILEKAQKTGDLNRLMWTLESGATPLSRIYATMKRLKSNMTQPEIQSLVNESVAQGKIQASPHPFNEGEFFYQISSQ